MKESYYIHSKEVRLYTTIKGNSNADKVIIILHGGPGSGADPLIENESFKELEKDFILVYFDQRGSGKSTYDLEQQIMDHDISYDVHVVVNDVKRRFQDKRIFLWGGSFGGALGFLYLRNYPCEVERYVSACPAIFFTDNGMKNTVKNLLNSYKSRIPKSFLFLVNTIPMSSEGIKGVLKRKSIKNFIFSSNSKSLKHSWAMREWLFDQRFGEDLENIKIPVLITHGNKDKLIDYHIASKEYKNIKNKLIEFKEYDMCGHNVFDDKKEEFVEDIKRFFH
ncbi:MAG: alpha/beta fold hydrolase [Clostridium sp.]